MRQKVLYSVTLQIENSLFIFIEGLWDSFLEGRIKLQKVAGIINKMPQFDIWKDFEKDENEEFKQSAEDSKYNDFKCH